MVTLPDLPIYVDLDSPSNNINLVKLVNSMVYGRSIIRHIYEKHNRIHQFINQLSYHESAIYLSWLNHLNYHFPVAVGQ